MHMHTTAWPSRCLSGFHSRVVVVGVQEQLTLANLAELGLTPVTVRVPPAAAAPVAAHDDAATEPVECEPWSYAHTLWLLCADTVYAVDFTPKHAIGNTLFGHVFSGFVCERRGSYLVVTDAKVAVKVSNLVRPVAARAGVTSIF